MYRFFKLGFPGGSDHKALCLILRHKEYACNAGDPSSIPGLGRSLGRGNGWLPTPVFLPGEFHRQRSLMGYSPWCHMTLRHDWETNTFTTLSLLFFKLDVILGLWTIKWMGVGNWIQMTITSTPVGKNPIEWSSPYSQQNSLKHTTWVQSQKWLNDLGSFPRQIIQHHSIQVYAPTTDAKEAEVEWFYEALQEDVPELTPKMKSFSSKGIVMQK